MFKSLFHRILWTTYAIVLAVILLIAISMTLLLGNRAVESKFESAKNASKTIEGFTATLLYNNYSPAARQFYDNYIVTISDVIDSNITIIDTHGRVFCSTNQNKPISPKHISQVLSDKTIKQFDSSPEHDYIIGIPLKDNDRIIGGVFFTTEIPKIQGSVSNVLLMFLLASIIALLVASLLVYLYAKRTVTPLKELNKAVLEIASGNFKKRLTPGKDEIGQIASSFNHMASSLEKLEDMRSEFVSDISHELRTPMTSISGFISGILDGTIPPEKEKEYLKIVYDESNRLAKLTNDMLEMSKRTSPEYKLDISEFDINELIRLCIIQLEQNITDKSLELDVNLTDSKLMVLGDKGSIQRVIINILDNAIKFGFPDSTITISATKKATKVYVSIGNLGIGIDEKDINHIFDRFYKTDKSRSKDTKGAGLGLALSKNIIDLHHQDIWVESVNTGKNSRFTNFTFTLELA